MTTNDDYFDQWAETKRLDNKKLLDRIKELEEASAAYAEQMNLAQERAAKLEAARLRWQEEAKECHAEIARLRGLFSDEEATAAAFHAIRETKG